MQPAHTVQTQREDTVNALEDGQRVWHELKDSFQGGGSREMKIDNFAFPLCFLLSKNTQRQDRMFV